MKHANMKHAATALLILTAALLWTGEAKATIKVVVPPLNTPETTNDIPAFTHGRTSSYVPSGFSCNFELKNTNKEVKIEW